MKLIQFVNENKAGMLRSLEWVVKDLQRYIQDEPEEYTELGTDTPSIDVRLCIDLDRRNPGYIFRTGLPDYDPYHSEYCAASCVTLDTDASELLDELINQLED